MPTVAREGRVSVPPELLRLALAETGVVDVAGEAQIRAAEIPESMPVSRAIRDFMVAHPPTPEGQPKEELLQLLMLSVMRLEGRVVVLERRSEAGTEFLEALAEIFPKQS